MSPPLTPDAAEARRQLAEELAKPIYADAQGWLADQWRKLLDWLTGSPDPAWALGSGQLTAVVVTAVAVAALGIWSVLGPLRSERRHPTAVLEAETRTADQLRADASRLAAAGEWAGATLQLFRALVRSLGERALIEEFPGMTAHEAAGRAAPRLPELAAGLAHSADVFDGLAYGRHPGSSLQYQDLLALDAAVTATRPVAALATAAAPSGVEVIR